MLSQSMEDYLEAIAVLKKKNGIARVKDIGALLKVKSPSVVSAVGQLVKKGYAEHEHYGCVELTAKGRERAEGIRKKHNAIVDFLSNGLNISRTTAEEDACKIEHVISEETYEKIIEFIAKK